MQSRLALRFLVTLRRPLHEISNIRREVGLHADVSENILPSSKNNSRRHDISQGLDREPLSLSPHFLLIRLPNPIELNRRDWFDFVR